MAAPAKRSFRELIEIPHAEFAVAVNASVTTCWGTMRLAGGQHDIALVRCEVCDYEHSGRAQALRRALDQPPREEEDLPWYQRY